MVIDPRDILLPCKNNFNRCMTSKLQNQKDAPEANTKVRLLNFKMTQMGLEVQLLGYVVLLEHNYLKESRNSPMTN
jgi:hypothetical protein